MLAPSEEPIRRTNTANGRYHSHLSGEQVSGTHRGVLRAPSGGVRPTGRSVRIPYIQVLRFRDGKHPSFNLMFDRLLMLEQLGLVPAHTRRA